jgi:hypothetical protein
MGSGHPNGTDRPRLWQIERPLDEGMPVPRNVADEHADLTVDDLACRACILPGDAARRFALLEKPGLIDHQHGVVIGQRLDCITPDDVAQSMSIPASSP